MNTNNTQSPALPTPPITHLPSNSPWAPFDAGLAAGLSQDAGAEHLSQGKGQQSRLITGLRSHWLHQRCLVCGHSFRPGDEAVPTADGAVIHDMPGLWCADRQRGIRGNDDNLDHSNRDNEQMIGEFFIGLHEAWPMPEDVPVIRLEAGHPLLANPGSGRIRTSCRICGHTFRVFDQVVICPCSPLAPKCQCAVHRDTLKQLHCWDEWMRGREGDSCLGMS
ncbi:MAG: hypothetical protein BECKG1743D_GA0114223_105433 [Candidatus Kentron sp. G]|nr:MAG: hypothetical protein BECKG1743F_GA0114225_104523 [Candidatus Kentron sp. G]VFN02164.1 MAG: hypothetical protein BECKG1743E_GA0114224_104793 [Candidatus Kentron sp. G]VFN04074.1 MAG: hypothetical protein BECKG1743D_GA0114223_105433 [Candidatus Kentron sp. G]